MTAESESSRPLRIRKQDFVREQIFGAAIFLLSKKGYDTATVEEIAAAAGVSRRTFFRYFPSKEDLMVLGTQDYERLLSDAVRESPAALQPLEIIRAAVLSVAQRVTVQPRSRQLMRIASESAVARSALLSRFGEIEDHLASELRSRITHFSKDDRQPRLMAAVTLLALNLVFRVWFEQKATDLEALVDQILSSLGSILAKPVAIPLQTNTRAAGREGRPQS